MTVEMQRHCSILVAKDSAPKLIVAVNEAGPVALLEYGMLDLHNGGTFLDFEICQQNMNVCFVFFLVVF